MFTLIFRVTVKKSKINENSLQSRLFIRLKMKTSIVILLLNGKSFSIPIKRDLAVFAFYVN